MRKRLIGVLALAVAAGGCVVNSDSDCRTLCTWWQRSCTSETVNSCVADCLDTTESASQGLARCVNGEGCPASIVPPCWRQLDFPIVLIA